MLPTIDISLIGIVLAVWNVIKVIWDYASKAMTWIMTQALALLIGSKFWATAAFLSVALVIISFFSYFLSLIANKLLELAIPSGTIDKDVLDFLAVYVDGDAIVDCVTSLVSSWAAYHVILSLDFTRRLFIRFYTLLSQAWKT